MRIFFVWFFCVFLPPLPFFFFCHLFKSSSAPVRSLPFLSFIVPIFAWTVSLVSLNFFAISSLSLSIVFLYCFSLLFFLFSLCIVHLRLSYLSLLLSGTLNSIGCIFPFLLFLSLLFFCQLIVRTAHATPLFLPWEPHEQYERHLLYSVCLKPEISCFS